MIGGNILVDTICIIIVVIGVWIMIQQSPADAEEVRQRGEKKAEKEPLSPDDWHGRDPLWVSERQLADRVHSGNHADDPDDELRKGFWNAVLPMWIFDRNADEQSRGHDWTSFFWGGDKGGGGHSDRDFDPWEDRSPRHREDDSSSLEHDRSDASVIGIAYFPSSSGPSEEVNLGAPLSTNEMSWSPAPDDSSYNFGGNSKEAPKEDEDEEDKKKRKKKDDDEDNYLDDPSNPRSPLYNEGLYGPRNKSFQLLADPQEEVIMDIRDPRSPIYEPWWDDPRDPRSQYYEHWRDDPTDPRSDYYQPPRRQDDDDR